jgi:hypothetical protein
MRKHLVRSAFTSLVTAILCAATWHVAKAAEDTKSVKLISTAFASGKPIPIDYTCDGKDLSPPLSWTNVPPGTKSLALICEDPDAPGGIWTHWVLYGLPAETTQLPAGVGATASLPGGGSQGLNSFNRIGYGGPCPPPGKTHRYFFRIYALDSTISLSPNADTKELSNALKGHVMGQGELIGTYRRK